MTLFESFIKQSEKIEEYFTIKNKFSVVLSGHERLFFISDTDKLYALPWYSSDFNNVIIWKLSSIGDKMRLIIISNSDKRYENLTKQLDYKQISLGGELVT